MFYPENKNFSNAEERAFVREELVYNVTEDILLTLEDLEVSKKELAHRLGKSRSYVTQVLSGARNMTLGSLSDICFALGVKPKVNIVVEPILDDLAFDWTMENDELKVEELIQNSQNIFDCRDRKEWKTLVA
ncbi:MAG TPA: XRE family transcriptional regulator [Gammaproteobacteria bacterium]|nr:XRE family transcriptional regulator [Gammaproteobacteria bacterium]